MSDRVEQAIPGSFYTFDQRVDVNLQELHARVTDLRKDGSLSPGTLHHLQRFFRIKNIYNSNAIEGNSLTIGETRQVIEQGLTITGKPLKDSLEAKNLDSALDLFEQLADREGDPIRGIDIRQLHQLVLAGVDDENAGKYRTVQVGISGSVFRPPAPEDISPKMDEFLKWLESITAHQPSDSVSPILLACVAHTWLVYIHPFIDGNGRVARLLMNLVLMRFGYPVAIITRQDRERYYEALEESHNSDLTPFIRLVYESVIESLEEYQKAALEQRERIEWAESVVKALTAREEAKARNEYEVWRSAMDLLKSYFRQTVDMINSEPAIRAGLARVYFKDFGVLDFEKYLNLRNGVSEKKTWFFRLDFLTGNQAKRYLFFFGYSSYELRPQLGGRGVTLFPATEINPFDYRRLSDLDIESTTPSLVEVGYLPEKEEFLCRLRGGSVIAERVEAFGRQFIEQVIRP